MADDSSQNELLDYKKILHEPIAPYFANTYNTLLSVVQGVALGFLFSHVSDYIEKYPKNLLENNINFIHTLSSIFYQHPEYLFKMILLLGMIGVVWHRYVSHDQYVVWRLRWFDTYILIAFALVQYLLVLSLDNSLFDFMILTLVFYLFGFIAYKFASRQKKGRHQDFVFNDHFIYENLKCKHIINKELGLILFNEKNNFTNDFKKEINSFEKKACCYLLYLLIFHIVFALLIHILISCNLYNELLWTFIYTIFGIGFLVILVKFDLNYKLKKSKILKKYRIPFGRN